MSSDQEGGSVVQLERKGINREGMITQYKILYKMFRNMNLVAEN